MFKESWILRVSCKVSEAPFMNISGLLQNKWSPITLQETRSIHGSMNRPNIEFIACIYIFVTNIENKEIIYNFGTKQFGI